MGTAPARRFIGQLLRALATQRWRAARAEGWAPYILVFTFVRRASGRASTRRDAPIDGGSAIHLPQLRMARARSPGAAGVLTYMTPHAFPRGQRWYLHRPRSKRQN